MTDGPEGQGPDDEIQGILNDLDDILKTITGADAQAQPPAEKKPPEKKPAQPQPPAEPKAPPAAQPGPPPAKPATPPPQIELTPRSGVMPTKPSGPTPSGPTPPPKEPKPGTPAPAAEKPAAAPPPPGTPQAPRTAGSGTGPPPAKPAPAPAAPAAQAPPPAFQEEPIPKDVPKEQIRRLAFLYAVSHRQSFLEFAKFLKDVAQKVSKKPLYVHVAYAEEVSPQADPKEVLERVKKSGAVGVLGVGLEESRVRGMDDAFDAEDFFFREVPPQEATKRTTAIDLVVDMMLLKAG